LKGGASKPISKFHPIMSEKYILFDYSGYENLILEGSYSYPFTLHLPEWLPQSHLCFNTPDQKKLHILNTFKIRYNLIAAIESSSGDKIVETVKQGVTMEEMQQMLHCRRITVITPEFSEPLLNQEIRVASKIRSMGLMGSGTCEYTVKFEKDVLYPKDVIKLQVDINNEKCSKKIDKYKIKLLRRTQVFNLKTTKPIYTNDFILVSEKMESSCEAKKKETKTFEF